MFFLKNKIVIAVIAITTVVLILTGISNLTGKATSPVASAVRVVFSPAQKVVSLVSSKVNNFTVFILEMNGYKNENNRMVGEINQIKKDNRSVEEYKNENDRLRGLLGLKEEMSNYDTVAAQVIAYGTNNWYDNIEINKGNKDGLTSKNVVLTPEGVVGQITDTGSKWAKVSTIIDTDHAIGVRVLRTSDIAIVEGDTLLAKDGYCKMSFISKDAKIIVGDVLETSGLGGIYPSGISVGKIREIKSDTTGTLQYAVVEPFVDFKNIHEVLVIK